MPAHYWWLLFAVGLACLDLACASLCPAFSLKVCQFLDSLHLQTWIFNFSLLFFLFSPSPTLPSPSSSSPTHTLSLFHTHTYTHSHIHTSMVFLTSQSCSLFLVWLLSVLPPACLDPYASSRFISWSSPWKFALNTPPPTCPKQSHLLCATEMSYTYLYLCNYHNVL